MVLSEKVLFTDDTHPITHQMLMEAGVPCEFNFSSPKEEIEAIIHQYIGIVQRSRITIDRSFLEKATNLKFIGRSGVGVDHIDMDLAAAKNISVITTPEGSRDTVAEHTIGLLLALMNRLHQVHIQIQNGIWLREENRGTEIKGKTIAVIGYGNMGTAFAKRLAGFEANVIAYDKFKQHYGDNFAKAVSLETVFEEADIVSLHIPYLPENRYFVDGTFLDKFRKPIYIVNTARGWVLNTADLVDRLKSGQVKGAALDVIEYEESSFAKLSVDLLPEPYQFLRHADNVVLSPHIAGWSHEAKIREAEVLASKILSFLNLPNPH